MSALAKYLSGCGYTVSGSDATKSATTENLAFYGVKTFIGNDGNRAALLEADCVVYTDAISLEDKEFLKAKELNKILYGRAELLGIICQNFQHVITVAGSHGKTTCTSICAHILKSTSVPFMAHIGGEDCAFGNYYYSGEDYLVTEACEYKKNLLKLKSDVAILLNVDKDHMECYENEQDLLSCFHRYCQSAKTAFVCADDASCGKWEFASFGIKNTLADYRATQIRAFGERYSFTVEEYGKPVCRVRLRSIGYCNIYNALAAFAAMRSLGFHEKEIVKGIESFTAVKRRFEKIGEYRGASFICDYAHHPKEILSTLHTAKNISPKKLYVVFQPHTYSRTKLLMADFISVLRSVPNLMIYKTYPAREVYDELGSAETLARILGNCLYAENAHVLKTWLKQTVKDGDVVLFLGAGDIYYVAQYILEELL
ncbi:MAG: hypothetical protein IJ308_07330 [Clostridia bacterium]|nr:hypothetical protein [Clostridia bacterium]